MLVYICLIIHESFVGGFLGCWEKITRDRQMNYLRPKQIYRKFGRGEIFKFSLLYTLRECLQQQLLHNMGGKKISNPEGASMKSWLNLLRNLC